MRDMTPVTLVMPYYMNPTMLEKHWAMLRMLPLKIRDQVSVVIVDDGSPSGPALPTDTMPKGMSIQIYRIIQDVRWNQDAARNIGVAHVETEWVLLTDIDHIPTLEAWEQVVLRTHNPNYVYRFARVSAPAMDPYKPHPNSWLMTRTMYDKVGGYDERFAGLYGTDGDFRDRVAEYAEIHMFKQALIRVPRSEIADASTTTYLRKQAEDRDGLDRVRKTRAALPLELQFPLRYTFAFVRVYP
jgi:hypothetical protein